MKSLSSKTYQCGVTIQGLTTLSGTVYLTGITNTASWDHVIVGTTAQGQIYTRTYAQFMGDVATGISLSSYVTGSGTTNYLPKFTGGSALGNSQIFDNGTNVGIGTASPNVTLEANGIIRSDRVGVASQYVQINGGDAAGPFITAAGAAKVLTIQNNSTTSSDIYFDQAVASTYQFKQASVTKMILDASGNVGIATSAPTAKLHLVMPDVASAANPVTGSGWSEYFWNQSSAPSDATRVLLLDTASNTASSRVLGIGFAPGYTGHQNWGIYASAITGGSANEGNLHFVSQDNSVTYRDVMTMLANGNVLIGTTTDAGYKLDVNGSSAFRNDMYVFNTSTYWYNGTSYFQATNSSDVGILKMTNNTSPIALQPNGGNVGIGTTSPATKFHVHGYTNIDSVDVVATFSSDNTAKRVNIGYSTSGDYGFINAVHTGVAWKNLIFGVNGGNVGIGTTSPSAKLHVVGDTYIQGTEYILQSVNSTVGYLYFDHSGTQVWKQGIFNDNTSTFSIGNGGGFTRLFNITNGGNIGIGTTSPSQKLDVNGYAKFTSGIILDGGATSHYREFIWNTSGFNRWDLYVYGAEPGSNVGGDLFLARYADNGAYIANTVTFQRSTGNVGIGTSNPSYQLQITAAAANDANFLLDGTDRDWLFQSKTGTGLFNIFDNTASASRLAIDSSGNVGIGTTAPARILELKQGEPYLRFNPTTNSAPYLMGAADGKFYIIPESTYVPTMAFSSGNVGIGTNSPNEKLHVAGNINAYVNGGIDAGLFASTSAGSTTIALRSNGVTHFNGGNVGIGTASPYGRLELNGSGQSWTTAPVIRMWDSFNSKGWLVGNANNYTSGDFYIRTLPSVSGDPGAGQQEFTIKHATGNVGIGTSSPANKLVVTSDASPTNENTYAIAAASASDPAYKTIIGYDYTNDIGLIAAVRTGIGWRNLSIPQGSLGIGTYNPGAKLHVVGNAWINRPSNKVDNASCTELPSRVEFNNAFTAGSTGYTVFTYPTPSVFRIYADYDGNIGGLQPDLQLGLGYLTVKNSGGTIGNIGIGTTSPAYKLDVIGTLGVTGDTTIGGNIAGARTLNLISSDNAVTYDINFQQYGTSVFGRIRYEEAASDFQFYAKSDTDPNLTLQWGGNSYFQRGNVGIGTTTPATKLDVSGVITATGGNSTNWNTAYGWGNHASASYVPQARTLTINGTSYDLSANRSWTIPTSANIQEAANNGKVTTAASVGTTVITTVATATYDGATFNYVLKDGTNYRAGTIIAVWSAGAVQFNETTTNDIGSTVGVTFAVALNAGNAELRATSATSGWTVKVVTIGI
jgi:hypothetical protein